jgi:DNA-binding LacI/PurR family transcriptional regulator
MPEDSPPSPSARVSLRDVARDVGVSHVTVSLALRGDPRVSVNRRVEIEAAALRLGYRPDPMLSSLSAYRRSKRPVTICSTVAWLNQWADPGELHRLHEFEAYWTGARDAAEKLGYRLEEFKIRRDLSSDRLQKILEARSVHGILIPPHRSDLSLPNFDWSRFSLVRLGVSVKEPRTHVVTSDQMSCVGMAFERVHERGYQRIGYVSSRRFDRNTGGNFRAGYLSSQDALLPLRKHLPPLFLEEESTAADARQLRAWLKLSKPDAIITTLSALRGLLDRIGCKIPDDVAVCATSVFDGNFDSGIDQNSSEVGYVAMRTLASLIHQNERGIPRYCRRILVEPRWVDGSSLPIQVS